MSINNMPKFDKLKTQRGKVQGITSNLGPHPLSLFGVSKETEQVIREHATGTALSEYETMANTFKTYASKVSKACSSAVVEINAALLLVDPDHDGH